MGVKIFGLGVTVGWAIDYLIDVVNGKMGSAETKVLGAFLMVAFIVCIIAIIEEKENGS